MKEAHPLEKLITDDTMAYVQTDEGKKECKELFPDDTQQNILRTASLFLDHYVKWTGQGSGNKYEHLSNKLGHPETRKKNTKNYGYYVKKAKESLDKRAVDLDLALPQPQAPTSNNDINAAGVLSTPKRGATPPGEEVTKQPDTLNQATTEPALLTQVANLSISNNKLIRNQDVQIGQNAKRIELLEKKDANQQRFNQVTDGRLCNLEEKGVDHEARIKQLEYLTAEKKRQARKDDVQEEEEYGGVKKGLFHDENAGNYDSDDQTGSSI